MGNFNLAEIFFYLNQNDKAEMFYDRAIEFDTKSYVSNFIDMTQPSLVKPDINPERYLLGLNFKQVDSVAFRELSCC